MELLVWMFWNVPDHEIPMTPNFSSFPYSPPPPSLPSQFSRFPLQFWSNFAVPMNRRRKWKASISEEWGEWTFDFYFKSKRRQKLVEHFLHGQERSAVRLLTPTTLRKMLLTCGAEHQFISQKKFGEEKKFKVHNKSVNVLRSSELERGGPLFSVAFSWKVPFQENRFVIFDAFLFTSPCFKLGLHTALTCIAERQSELDRRGKFLIKSSLSEEVDLHSKNRRSDLSSRGPSKHNIWNLRAHSLKGCFRRRLSSTGMIILEISTFIYMRLFRVNTTYLLQDLLSKNPLHSKLKKRSS